MNETSDAAAARWQVKSYAPATGELLSELRITTPAEVAATVARAKRAQAAWAVLTVEERAERLLRFRDALLERADEMVDLIALETGKPRQEALVHEVFVALDLMTYYASQAPRALADKDVAFHLFRHRRGVVRYTPAGVVGVISPWNCPLVIPLGTVVAALVAGNAVVVKPSETTPLVMLKAKEIYDSTGMREDLFSVVVGYGETGEALIDSGIQRMVFTGSVAVGKKVGAACGARLVPCVLELGGKAPLIARADADIEKTAHAIVNGGFANGGQACTSVERVYADEKIHDALVARTVAIVRTLRQGDSRRGEVDVGPMIFAPQLAIVERLVRDAIERGAPLEIGGRRRSGRARERIPPRAQRVRVLARRRESAEDGRSNRSGERPRQRRLVELRDPRSTVRRCEAVGVRPRPRRRCATSRGRSQASFDERQGTQQTVSSLARVTLAGAPAVALHEVVPAPSTPVKMYPPYIPVPADAQLVPSASNVFAPEEHVLSV
jgi:acyl-CoA reductase-like NAD-dependent aldehyde dehydrogenase